MTTEETLAPKAGDAAVPAKVKRPSQPWAKGQSGNPRGRQSQGSLVRDALEQKRPELVQKAIELALGGDSQTLRTVLGILAPPARPEPLLVSVPALAAAKTPAERGEAIVAAVGRGKLDIESAAVLLRALADSVRVVEVDHLLGSISARLDALEENRP